jgi:hypothetical protein
MFPVHVCITTFLLVYVNGCVSTHEAYVCLNVRIPVCITQCIHVCMHVCMHVSALCWYTEKCTVHVHAAKCAMCAWHVRSMHSCKKNEIHNTLKKKKLASTDKFHERVMCPCRHLQSNDHVVHSYGHVDSGGILWRHISGET